MPNSPPPGPFPQADKDGDGVVTFDEFVIVSKKFPNILVSWAFVVAQPPPTNPTTTPAASPPHHPASSRHTHQEGSRGGVALARKNPADERPALVLNKTLLGLVRSLLQFAACALSVRHSVQRWGKAGARNKPPPPRADRPLAKGWAISENGVFGT